MPQGESHRWRWTLSLLTAASACLVPVESVDSSEESSDPGVSIDPGEPSAPAEISTPTLHSRRGDSEHSTDGATALVARDRLLPAQPTRLAAPAHPTLDQLLVEPGPATYLIAPSHSPPGI